MLAGPGVDTPSGSSALVLLELIPGPQDSASASTTSPCLQAGGDSLPPPRGGFMGIDPVAAWAAALSAAGAELSSLLATGASPASHAAAPASALLSHPAASAALPPLRRTLPRLAAQLLPLAPPAPP
mmetsp:Transcript_86878/g.198340  ORF Transcript_86878/g.198340 Transcript_86878/m.198340 type:complete len:127 (+) Transcript_86878:96-476(+)